MANTLFLAQTGKLEGDVLLNPGAALQAAPHLQHSFLLMN